MKRTIFLSSFILTALVIAAPVYATEGDVARVQNFITNVIQVLVVLAGSLSTGFFVWGGVGYITSTGDPSALEKSKKTIINSSIGLAITSGAYIIANIVMSQAEKAFGSI